MASIAGMAHGLKTSFGAAFNAQLLGAFLGGIVVFTGVVSGLSYVHSQYVQKEMATVGNGATDVVKMALHIDQHLTGPGMNDYGLQDSGLQDVISYWKTACGGSYCATAVPPGSYSIKGPQLIPCNGGADCTNYEGLQCVQFVATSYAMAGHALPAAHNATDFWGDYAHRDGWEEKKLGSELPLPGDILDWTGGLGHVEIVVEVNPPGGSTPGSVILAQANGYSNIVSPTQTITDSGIHLHSVTLLPNLTFDTQAEPLYQKYDGNFVKLIPQGFIRNPSLDLPMRGASARLVRLYQGDRSQYKSQSEYDTYWGGACSTTSMTEVLDAYGGKNASGTPIHITDVLETQLPLQGMIGGLQGREKVAATVKGLGFDAIWGGAGFVNLQNKSSVNLTLRDVVEVADSGSPVIVGLPPYDSKTPGNPYTHPFGSDGHVLVVIGGNKDKVYLADSSGSQAQPSYTSVAFNEFDNHWWDKFYAIVIPKVQPGMPDKMPNSPWVQVTYNEALYYRIDPTYFVKQIDLESEGFQTNRTSPTGAQGIAQFEPAKAADVGLTDSFDSGPALDASAKLMAQYINQYGSQPGETPNDAEMKALAAYNGGPGAVDTAVNKAIQAEKSSINWDHYLYSDVKAYINHIMGTSI